MTQSEVNAERQREPARATGTSRRRASQPVTLSGVKGQLVEEGPRGVRKVSADRLLGAFPPFQAQFGPARDEYSAVASAAWNTAAVRPRQGLRLTVGSTRMRQAATRWAPATVIALLAWDIAALDAVHGRLADLERLDGIASALTVGVGAIAIIRWRILGERALLWTGATLLLFGLALPGRPFADLPPSSLVVIGIALGAVAIARWRAVTASSAPVAMFLLTVGNGAIAEVLSPGASSLFLLVGLLFAADGLSRGLVGAMRTQRAELAAARADESAARAAREEREHDVRSALMAIDGAARTLERYHDRLDADSRSMLAGALSTEVGRLQRLIVEPVPEANEPFGVADVLRSVTALAAIEGLAVDVGGSRSLTAIGRPEHTAQIVRTLLDNARVHAPGSPVNVHIAHRAEFVIVRIEDRGPGVDADEHEAIFERGRRGRRAADGTGRGLGLSTAARLATAQGGALWVEDRPGGGATFVLRLQRA